MVDFVENTSLTETKDKVSCNGCSKRNCKISELRVGFKNATVLSLCSECVDDLSLKFANFKNNKVNEKMKKEIDRFINSDDEELNLEPFRIKESIGDIVDYIGNNYGCSFDDIESNGWQADLAIGFEADLEFFSISFCSYYNNGMKIFREGER